MAAARAAASPTSGGACGRLQSRRRLAQRSRSTIPAHCVGNVLRKRDENTLAHEITQFSTGTKERTKGRAVLASSRGAASVRCARCGFLRRPSRCGLPAASFSHEPRQRPLVARPLPPQLAARRRVAMRGLDMTERMGEDRASWVSWRQRLGTAWGQAWGDVSICWPYGYGGSCTA
jgi:hypothetical protein